MGIRQAVEECVTDSQAAYVEEHGRQSLRHIPCAAETLWSKLDHLLYLPVLGLTRPRDLYYDQGEGLRVLYGFTYKYLTVEHFLGQLTRLQVGTPLAKVLAHQYAQAWYPDQEALYLFADWHVKPHWTKAYSHAGHVTMWGRTMPGTKQLILNGTHGEILGGWNYAIDAHLTHVLVDLEEELSQTLQREIHCTIIDGEGGGQPLAERYAEAGRFYISVLPRQHDHPLTDFAVVGSNRSSMIQTGKPSSPTGLTPRRPRKTPVALCFFVRWGKRTPRGSTADGFTLTCRHLSCPGCIDVAGRTMSAVSVTWSTELT